MRLFHISDDPALEGRVLIPRIPDNHLIEAGYEDDSTPRVCFAESIEGCLKSKRPPIEQILFVYCPKKPYKMISNEIVKDRVPDAQITTEIWITEPCEVYLYDIILTNGINESSQEYIYFVGEEKYYLYDFEYFSLRNEIKLLKNKLKMSV